jgi:SAM-dependent methyltransferase
MPTTALSFAPFDALAETYDRSFTDSAIGQAQRRAVWRELGRVFHPGDYVLEIGCGTGVDACYLAGRGVRVLACDNSPRMIAMTSRRVEAGDQSALVEPCVLPAEQIGNVGNRERFNGVFSNFGALNCVDDLHSLARDLGKLLMRGSTALLCLMGRYCAWEIAWYLAQGNARKAMRRFNPAGLTVRLTDSAKVHVRYASVRWLTRTFSPEFRLRYVRGIGIAVPPSYLEHLASRYPSWLRTLAKADSFLERCPGVRAAADHILLNFERVDDADGTQPWSKGG